MFRFSSAFFCGASSQHTSHPVTLHDFSSVAAVIRVTWLCFVCTIVAFCSQGCCISKHSRVSALQNSRAPLQPQQKCSVCVWLLRYAVKPAVLRSCARSRLWFAEPRDELGNVGQAGAGESDDSICPPAKWPGSCQNPLIHFCRRKTERPLCERQRRWDGRGWTESHYKGVTLWESFWVSYSCCRSSWI